MKKKVILRGPFCTQSGYGQHASQLARYALSRDDWDCKFLLTPWGNTPWILDPAARGGLNGQIMARTIPNPIPDADLSIQVQLPNEWTRLAYHDVGVTAGVETDKCNPLWIESINKMSTVIVPSKFVKNTFEATGAVKIPVHVVPEAFTDECINPKQGKFSFSTNFNFLIFGQITGNNQLNDRKNTFNTIKWLCELYRDDPTVGIIIKTNMGRNTALDRQMSTNLFKQLIKEVRSKSQFPKIHLLHGDMSDAEVASLYVHPTVKCLVTATRGEGYGLPILEAAACGLPVLATNWSGHLDFLQQGKFVGFNFQLQPVHQSKIDNAIFLPGMKWAEVYENDFKTKVNKFKNSSIIPKKWAIELRQSLLETHNFSQISNVYDKIWSK